MGSDITTGWYDAGTVFSSPARFTTTQWLATGGVVAGTAILFTADQSIRNLAQRNQSSVGSSFANIGTDYGNTVTGGVIGAAIYLGGLAANSESVRVTGRMTLESLIFAGGITLVLKSIIGRSRPYTGEGPDKVNGFQFNTDNTSLPSGHTTVAFAVSSALAARIQNTYATIGLYGLATLTMGARVYQDQHWFSDTFLGAAIGTAIGNAVAGLHGGGDANTSQSFRITPSLNGLGFAYNF